MKSFARFFLVGAMLWLPALWLGRALDFGGFAWLITLICISLVAGLADRDYFYGPRDS